MNMRVKRKKGKIFYYYLHNTCELIRKEHVTISYYYLPYKL